MLLARSRGVVFEQVDKLWVPAGANYIAGDCLHEVAVILAYGGMGEYNEACLKRPNEVRARLAAL